MREEDGCWFTCLPPSLPFPPSLSSSPFPTPFVSIPKPVNPNLPSASTLLGQSSYHVPVRRLVTVWIGCHLLFLYLSFTNSYLSEWSVTGSAWRVNWTSLITFKRFGSEENPQSLSIFGHWSATLWSNKIMLVKSFTYYERNQADN